VVPGPAGNSEMEGTMKEKVEKVKKEL